MANEPQKIDAGVFIDTKTNEIVHEKPEEGIQLVPEGGLLDDVAKGRIAAEGGDVVGLETASSDDEVETADDKSKTVTSKAARGK